MADFEGLIRQALARQNADDPAIREKIYQSSRNALARMIASAGAQPPDLINEHRKALENSIRRIEASYSGQNTLPDDTIEPPDPQPVAVAPQAVPPSAHPGAPDPFFDGPVAAEPSAPVIEQPVFEPQPVPAPPDMHQSPPELQVPQPAPATPHDPSPGSAPAPAEPAIDAAGAPSVGPEDMPTYPVRRRRPGRLIAIIVFLCLLGLVGWLLFTLADTLTLDDRSTSLADSQPATTGSAQSDPGSPDGDYITVLSPVSTGTLVTAGRGRAQIVNQSNMDYIRLVSLRSGSALDATAEPILLALEPGVIGQISGRRVTVEILAKSGGSGPANFAVGCRVGDQDVCGRKRFRIGLQPEATVFTMNVPGGLSAGDEAYLTINTDVSTTAAQSGEGAAVDILYARLRLPEQ